MGSTSSPNSKLIPTLAYDNVPLALVCTISLVSQYDNERRVIKIARDANFLAVRPGRRGGELLLFGQKSDRMEESIFCPSFTLQASHWEGIWGRRKRKTGKDEEEEKEKEEGKEKDNNIKKEGREVVSFKHLHQNIISGSLVKCPFESISLRFYHRLPVQRIMSSNLLIEPQNSMCPPTKVIGTTQNNQTIISLMWCIVLIHGKYE